MQMPVILKNSACRGKDSPLRYHHKKKGIFTQTKKTLKPPYTGASVAHVRARLVHCTITCRWVGPCPMLWKKI
jgi:hypothetical protein